MNLRDNPRRFGLVTIANHWFTALIVIGMVILGLYMADLPKGPDKNYLVALHKSFGVLVLMLGLFRVIWRTLNTMPLAVSHDAPWMHKLARLIHVLLIALLLLLPLSGWVMSSASARPVAFFGLFTLPSLVAEDKNLAGLVRNLHEAFAWTLIALFALHVSAALKHHFYAHNSTLRRMLGMSSDSDLR